MSIASMVAFVWLLGAYFVLAGAVALALAAADRGFPALAQIILLGLPAIYIALGIGAVAYVFAHPRRQRSGPSDASAGRRAR